MTCLEDLPPELLRRIFEYALPQGLTFSFERQRYHALDSEHRWNVFAARRPHPSALVVGELNHPRKKKRSECKMCLPLVCKHDDIANDMQTALLYINKAIASEARGM